MSDSSTPPPTVGRVVHYVSYGTPGGEYPSACRAAIVTEGPGPEWAIDQNAVGADTVGLSVLNPSGVFFDRAVAHDEDTRAGGTWHWPERTP